MLYLKGLLFTLQNLGIDMNKNFLSIQQMNNLESLGVDASGASMCWVANFNDNGIANDYWLELNNGLKTPFCGRAYIPTFDLQDILDMIPKEIEIDGVKGFFFTEIPSEKIGIGYRGYTNSIFDNVYLFGSSYLDAAYKMLIWCIENKHVKI